MLIVFPKRIRFELVILGALALSSCAGPGLTERQRNEVAAIAKSQADLVIQNRMHDLDDRISDLASQVEVIKTQIKK